MIKNEYYFVEDFDTAKSLLEGIILQKYPVLSVDLETTSLDEFTGDILGIGLSWKVHTGIYIPINVRELGLFAGELEPRWAESEEKILVDLIRIIMKDAGTVKAAHNAVFEIKWLKHKWDAEPVNTFCTYLYRFIQRPETSQGYEHRLGLEFIIKEKYPDLAHLKDIWKGISNKPKDERDLSLYHSTEKIGIYCCGDCDVCLREYLADKEDMVGKPFDKLFTNRLSPAIHFASDMSQDGWDIDLPYLRRTRTVLKGEQATLLKEIQDTANSVRFNPASTLHLENLFIRQLKLPKHTQKKFDKHSNRVLNKISLDDTVLTEYYEKYGCKVANQILDYRRTSKLISSYFDNVEALINPLTGKIHADIKLHGTVTGRMSIRNPALQTLPVRDPKSRIVKNMFIAPEGYMLVGADYSQIELRLLAFYSQDPMLLKAFREGIDIHKLTASILFDCKVEEVTSEQRYIGKTANFALCYGAKAGVLVYGKNGIGNKILGVEYAQNIGIKYEDLNTINIDQEIVMDKARAVRSKFLSGYSHLAPYNKSVVVEARVKGYTVSDYGRIRYMDGINSDDKDIRENWERRAVNSRPQGTASDYLLFHFMDMKTDFDNMGLDTRPRLMVHDQLVTAVKEDDVDEVVKQVPILGIRKDESNIGIEMKLEPSVGVHLGEV